MRAFTQLWDRIGLERYGVTDPKARRFRYGVQVNSLGLTEAQPENNVQRIVLEMLGVTLSPRRPGPVDPAPRVERGARPARGRGTSSGRCACSRCWPSRPTCSSTRTSSRARRWSRRARPSWPTATWAELDDVLALGGAFEAIDELKGRLVRSHAERMRRIEAGELTVVGVNRFTETAAVAARGGEGSHPQGRSGAGGRDDRRRCRRGGPSATTMAVKRSLEQLRRAAEIRREHHAGHDRPGPRRRNDRASGPACCARCSASTGRRPAWPPRRARAAAARGCGPSPSG